MNKYEVFKNLAKKLKNPLKVQSYLRKLKYNKAESMMSALKTYKMQKAHCMEAALLAAAICEHLNYPPLIVSIESIDGLDHILFVYKTRTGWGSIARSRDEGLHGRRPKYKNIRELVKSYIEPYVDSTGCVQAYQIVHLDDTRTDWRFSTKNLWETEKYLIRLKHKKLKVSKQKYLKLKKYYSEKGPILKGKNWL